MITAMEAREKMPRTSLKNALVAQRLEKIEQKILEAAEHNEASIEVQIQNDYTQEDIVETLKDNWYEVTLINKSFFDDWDGSSYNIFKISW